ncbi:MAG: hypothetical protein QOG54_1415 [Actinomycetota bacterium]|nr:hypothetical protein [Actinomycetota bacterium]
MIARAESAESPEKTYASDNFKITWVDDARSSAAPDLTDDDGDGYPDAIVRLAQVFESARSFLLNDLGYLAPPNQGAYRVYVATGGNRTLSAPGGAGRSQVTFIIINPGVVNTSTTDQRLRSLAVHEYFHAIQAGYDSAERHWIKEASSSWVEDVFDDAADPNHGALMGFLPYPRLTLDAPVGDHEYGAFVFLQFLVERYGSPPEPNEIVRELWNEMAVPESAAAGPNRDALSAIATVLGNRGVSMTDAWREFTLWQRRLSLFQEGTAYRNVLKPTRWPSYLFAADVDGESCRQTTDRGITDRLGPLSADYARFAPAETSSGLAILSVEGPAGVTAFALVKRTGAPPETVFLAFSPDGVAQTQISFDAGEVKRVVLGLGNASTTDATMFYSLRLVRADETDLIPPTGPYEPTYGLASSFAGSVMCGGIGQPSALVEITEREDVGGETRTFVVRSGQTGLWSVLFTPNVNSTYSAKLVDPLLGPASTSEWFVHVHVGVSMAVSEDRVQLGAPAYVTGTLTPPHPDATIVIEYRRPDGEWQQGQEVGSDADGNYSAELVLPRDGIWLIRARMTTTGDEDHEPGVSPERTVEVVSD